MKRGIAALIALLLVLSGMPVGALAGTAQKPSDDGTTRLTLSQSEPLQQSTGTPQTSSYVTGRPVDDVTVETDENRLSLLVTDDKPEGTPLVLDRDWLSNELGKPVTFMRFHLQGELVDSYKLTEENVIVDIPHFSTQNVTVTTVDGQFQVDGSASGQETTRVINYDVNETGIAILAVEGSGTREGTQRVDQFYSEVDNSTFEWEAGEIPRNVTLEFTGQGDKLGPTYNKSNFGVNDGETVTYDLVAKDYEPNLTVVGAGEKNGTLVEKGPFTDGDGDTRLLSFDNSQNNASIVFTGNTTTKTTSGESTFFFEGWEDQVEPHDDGYDTGPGSRVSTGEKIVSSNVYEGSYALEVETSDWYVANLSGGGPGNTHSKWVYFPEDPSNSVGVQYGHDSNTLDYYGLYVDSGQLVAYNDTGASGFYYQIGDGTQVDSTPVSVSSGNYYQFVVIWNDDGSQTLQLKDISGNVLGELTRSTSPPSNSGFGFGGQPNTNGYVWDAWEVTGSTESTTEVKTEDPSITIDGTTASYSGVLNDSETVTVDFNSSIGEGTHTAEVNISSSSVVDWKYQGNNEARSHVKNITLNGKNYTVDQYLSDGETTTIPVENTQTLQGENVLTAEIYSDSETTHVSRIDARGHYEGRTILDNYTVNGEQSNLDETLADGETTSVNISSEAVYGTNNITTELTEDSVQDNYDAEIIWYPENRTYFENVTVNNQDFGSPTFLGTNETLLLNVTDGISPGDNDHVFRMQSEKTTTDSLDFTEKVEFYKNVSVDIEEAHATYNKSTTENFDYTASPGVQFNFSIPDRAMRYVKTSVTYDGQGGVQNTTTISGNNATVELDDEISEGTEVNVRIELLTYRVKNATTSLRSENALSAPYRVEIGIGNVTGDVTFETVEPVLTSSEYEVILTENGEPTEEPKIYSTKNNLTIPESNFDSASGFIVQQPQYSNITYTGTVNTIYPTTQVDPGRNIVHGPALYIEPDETYTPVDQYSVTELSSPLSVEWKQVGPYHLQWVTNESGPYNQTIENVTTEGVSVFADGDRYREFTRKDDDLVIRTNSSATWDVYQYDYPGVRGGTDVSVDSGQTETIEVEVYNPNDFTLHGVNLVLDHGWIVDDPVAQDIGAGETVTFEVDIQVPYGTQTTTYDLPMNVSSVETGEVETTDIEVDVGGGLTSTAGTPLTQSGLILGGVALLLGLLVYQLARSGWVETVRRELDKI